MGAYDTDLPKLKVPGMENPPAAMPQPTTDPMAGFKKQFADLASTAQVVGQTMSAPAPKPAPLHAPDTGSSVLPALQQADAYMRGKQDTAMQSARDVGANIVTGAQAVSNKMGEYAAQARTAPPPNGDYTSSGASLPSMLTAGSNANPGNSFNDWMNNKVVPGAGRFIERMTPTYARAAAASDLPAGEFDKQYFAPKAAPAQASHLNEGRSMPAPATAPVATPAKADTPAPAVTPAKADTPVPAATGPTKENGYYIPEIAPKTPSAGTQELINRQNASRTPVSDPYSGPAAGMAPPPGGTEGSIGVAGFQKQLQNIRALDGGVTGGFNAVSDPTESENAEKTKRWAMGDIADAMKRAGTRTERASLGQLLNTMANNDSQQTISAGQQRTQREVAQGNNAAHLQGVVMQGDTQRTVAQGNNNTHLQGITMQGANQRAMGMLDNATRLQVAGLDNAQKQQELAERIRSNNLTHDYHTKSLADTKAAREQQRALEARRLDIAENEPAATQPIGMLPGSYITKNNRVVDQSAVNAKLIAEAEKRKKAAGG